MYTPIQIPNVLNDVFIEHFIYKETYLPELESFIVCMWEVYGRKTDSEITVMNMIIPDGCIDLVVSYTQRIVGFSGMSVTDATFEDSTSNQSFGFRLRPGAVHALFGLNAEMAMDNFVDALAYLPIEDDFFDLGFQEAQHYLISRLKDRVAAKSVSTTMLLFETLNTDEKLVTPEIIANSMGYSVKQANRIFKRNFGLSMKQVLSVQRFQKAMHLLLKDNHASLHDLALRSGYYDQSHFNRDIKLNIGVSPIEVLQKYKDVQNIQ